MIDRIPNLEIDISKCRTDKQIIEKIIKDFKFPDIYGREWFGIKQHFFYDPDRNLPLNLSIKGIKELKINIPPAYQMLMEILNKYYECYQNGKFMWSPYYKYYQIRKDQFLSEAVDVETVLAVISNDSNLIFDGKLSFHNKSNFPWVSITMIYTKDGSYVVGENTFDKITLVEIITSRWNKNNEQEYSILLKNIAQQLNWEVIFEDDDGNEEILIIN